LGRARRRRRPLENGGGTTGSTASRDLAIFGTAPAKRRGRGRGAPKGGRHGMASWPCMRTSWRVRVRARARGPVQCGLSLGAVYGGKARRRPHGGPRSTTKLSRLPYAGRTRGCHVAGAATASTALLLFHLSVFANAKLEKVTTNLKISKNKSCRGVIDLQLSQRATYALINCLPGNVGRSWQKSRPELLFTACLTRFLANLHSKLECPPITKNVFPEITNNFRIGRF
jgi:hypothetical protein